MDDKFGSLLDLVADYILQGRTAASECPEWQEATEDFQEEAQERLLAIEHDLELPRGSLTECDAMQELKAIVDEFNDFSDDLLPGENMDGDADSALASCGHGNDEDYGGGDEHY